MALHKLVFDTTDANTIADSANVGAYVRSSDGTLITHVTEGSNERLHVDAAIRAADGTALTQTGGALDVNIASGTLNVNDAALADTAIANAVNTLDVASTAEDAVASPLANRKYLWIYNNGNRDIFIGSTGVTEAAGFPIPPGAILPMRAGAAIDIEWNGPNTSQEIRTLELS